MKLILSILILLISFVYDAMAVDSGLRYIKERGKILCGTDLKGKAKAYKDEDGIWQGFDVELCKVFSYAIFGRGDRFEMVHIDNDKAEKALTQNRADVMFGHVGYSPKVDLGKKITPAALLYYDRQAFLVRKIENTNSMEAYKNKNICLENASEDLANVQEYDNKYQINFNILPFNSSERAKEGFFLKRCEVMSGGEIFLKGLMKNHFVDRDNVFIPNETIAIKPVYVFVENDNYTLKITAKWVVNALMMAEQKGITSQNINIFKSDKDLAIRNLVGADGNLWKKFDLQPDWVVKAVSDVGNYREIYDRTLGKDSELNFDLKENKLIKDGGLIEQRPFI